MDGFLNVRKVSFLWLNLINISSVHRGCKIVAEAFDNPEEFFFEKW